MVCVETCLFKKDLLIRNIFKLFIMAMRVMKFVPRVLYFFFLLLQRVFLLERTRACSHNISEKERRDIFSPCPPFRFVKNNTFTITERKHFFSSFLSLFLVDRKVFFSYSAFRCKYAFFPLICSVSLFFEHYFCNV
jgi:hypothetical protein